MTSPYVRRSVRTFRVGESKNEFLPSPLERFVPYCQFQKALEMTDKFESICWANVCWILAADNLTFEEVMGYILCSMVIEHAFLKGNFCV